MQPFSYYPYPFFFKIFIQLLSCSFCLNNMIYCFIQHDSCFILLLAYFLAYFHMLPCLFKCQLPFLHALCFISCLDPSFLCVDVWVYMLTCLISCLQLCLAQIYMFVCLFYAHMRMSMPSHACMLRFVFFHAFMLTSTCLDVHLHAYMHISVLICIDWCIYLLRLMCSTCFYAISHVLTCFMPCLCAYAQTLFVIPCVIVALLFLLSHFLVIWPNGQDPIQTLCSLSSSIHQGPHQRVWIIPICMSRLACFYALCLCQPLQFQALPCLTPSATLILFGYI